jgi:hypothetical protein
VWRDRLLGAVAVAVLAAFVIVYFFIGVDALSAIEDTKQRNETTDPINDTELLSLATGLTGLVGGIVAVALSQQGEEIQQEGLPFLSLSWKTQLAITYTMIYGLLGLGAVAVWIYVAAQGADPPDALKALASVALGLFIPIVRTYFIPGEPPPT